MKRINKVIEKYKKLGIIGGTKCVYNAIKYKLYNRKHIKSDFSEVIINKDDYNNVILKSTKTIYIFATVPFYDVGGGQRSAQLSKIFNKMGFRVVYIYAFKSSEAKKYYMEIPTIKHLFIDKYSMSDFENDLGKNDIVIFEAPCQKFDDYLRVASQLKVNIIYENIDNWESNLGSILYNEQTLKKMLSCSNILTGTAQPLVDQLEKYLKKYKIKNNDILYLANAVDDELFNPNKSYEIPEDFIKGKKTLIYYGSLWGDWFDWNLIFGVAEKNPTYTILLIGDYSGILDKVDNAPSNVKFLGMKKQTELPAYLYYSDYAILPFKVDEIGKYVSPLKVFEYIAMNKLVISTSLPDIVGYPNVYCSDDINGWNKYINKDNKIDFKSAQEFISKNNWYDRCTHIIDQINTKEKTKCNAKYYNNISVIVLNYNNDKVIFKCIDSLLKYSQRYNYEIIVVDNKSTDGSYEKLLKNYKKNKSVTIVQNQKNGCSSGRNLGVKTSSNDYILFLDSDEWITNKYWLDNYIHVFENNKNIGAIGWGAGWFNKKGYAYNVVDSYAYRYMPANCIARCDIGYLATCGFLMSRKLFDDVEGFDEAFDPTCYEDTDLSLKIRNAGKEIYYSPYLGVGHLPHQTTKSGTTAHDKLIHEKGTYFVKKWSNINKDLIFKYKK